MPSPRQQRASHSQRALTRTNPGPAQDAPLGNPVIVGNTIVFECNIGTEKLIITGLPTVAGSAVPGQPTLVAQIGATCVFTFASPPTPGGTFSMLGGQPQVRRPMGGYLAAQHGIIPIIPVCPPPPTQVGYSATIVAGPAVIIDVAPSSLIVSPGVIPPFFNTTSLEYPMAALQLGAQVQLTYSTNPNVGEALILDATSTAIWSDAGALLANTNVIMV